MAGQEPRSSELLSSPVLGWFPAAAHLTGISPPPVAFNPAKTVRLHIENDQEKVDRRGADDDDARELTRADNRLSWQETLSCRGAPSELSTDNCLPLADTSSVVLPQRLRRASFEDQCLLPSKSNYELRRCKSEVTQPTDSSAKTGTEPNNPTAIAQNALTSKDKIQAFARTARELRTLKLHYYPESGWGWVILFCASVTQCVSYGLLLAAGTLMTAMTRRYSWTTTTNQPAHRFLVKPYIATSALEPAILAHNRPVYLSSTVSYPVPISSPVSGGWGWVIVVTTAVALTIGHGVQLTMAALLPWQILPINTSSSIRHSISWPALSLHSRGALAALSLCVASLLSPVIVAWCRRKSTRLTAVFGGLLAALGLLFTSFASQFHQLFLSYGLVLGIGVGLTRDTATLMVGQYFKRRREAVEIALVGSSGVGLALMTVFLHTTLGAIGWRLGLQAVTGLVLVTFILGSCYRSASLYHPQRRAILHLKNQRKKIKEKNKHEEKPPFFDFSSLKSRTMQTIMVSTASIAAGLYTPLIYLGYEAEKTHGRDSSMWLQMYMGLAWTLGCAVVGLLTVREPAECKIGRQYLCQAAGFLVSLALLSQAVVSSTPTITQLHSSQLSTAGSRYGLFCWIYGFGLGAYHYALKMFVYQRVRARNFARAWSFIQASQALPLVCGIPLAGYLSTEHGSEIAYYVSSAFVFTGSLALFVIDLRKYITSRTHSHKHQQHRRKPRGEGANAHRTPRVASEPNTADRGASGEIEGLDPIGAGDIEAQSDNEEDICPPSCKGRIRKDSLAEEDIHLPPLTLLQQTSLVLAQLGDLPCDAAAAELTCISEEGIADMDIPDHLLEDLDFAADCITSCDKVENYLMLSEYENNLIQQSTSESERKSRKTSIFRQIGQTLSGRHGNRSGGHPDSACHHLNIYSSNANGHRNRRLSSIQRTGRDDSEIPSKMVQIHETNESEGL